MKLSIVIPVYNEEETVLKLLEKVEKASLPQGFEREIIIVDDCSIDRTRQLLGSVEEKYRVILKEKNEGKGAAVKAGFMASTGDIILIQDADLEYDPSEYGELIRPILDGQADVVYGSRFHSHKPHRVLYYWHYVGNKVITTLSNIVTNLNLTDMETCYKAFSREALDKIKHHITARRFGIEPEITALVAKKNLRIYEVGISYFGRTYKEGKKINWKDGVAALWHIIRFNWNRYE